MAILSTNEIYNVPYDEDKVLNWLNDQGFERGDLRSKMISYYNSESFYTNTPMAHACIMGELNVCKWLYNHGAQTDVTGLNYEDKTPMHFACINGSLSVCKWLFENGANGDISKPDEDNFNPMYYACENDHFSVCRWLYDMGAVEDISKPIYNGEIPMHMACAHDNLSMCQWLFELGAAEDITKADEYGQTPIHTACEFGNLSVCKYLFEVGATEGFTMADGQGLTPIHVASKNGHISVCKLLIFNGALNETNSQHVRENIVFRDFKNASLSLILKLFTWLEDIINCQNNFLIVLNASVLIPNSHKKISKKRCRLPLLNRNNLEMISEYLDVEKGRRLRNVRELYDILKSRAKICWNH